jgi:hypothetical protein
MLENLVPRWPNEDYYGQLIICLLTDMLEGVSAKLERVESSYRLRWRNEHALTFTIICEAVIFRAGSSQIELVKNIIAQIKKQTS